jgi:DNA repair protein RadC
MIEDNDTGEWAVEGEGPRERLRRCGVEVLRDEELLAVVLGTGYRGKNALVVAREILATHPTARLLQLEAAELARLKGLGRVKAGALLAACELARRGLRLGLGVLPVVSSPRDTLGLLAEFKDLRREHFVCFYLNARNQVICRETVSIGSLSASIVHPREVFSRAVKLPAASVILAHNHPSGDVSPSRDDIELTRRLVEAGEILGIDVLDHIIIGAEDFLSFREKGLIGSGPALD